jgi:hypothetical protein
MTIFDVCLELRDCLAFVYNVLIGICYKLMHDGKKKEKDNKKFVVKTCCMTSWD